MHKRWLYFLERDLTATALPPGLAADDLALEEGERGQFKTALPAALMNVVNSLRLFGTDSPKQSREQQQRDAGQMKPAESGVAVWFVRDGIQVCIPIDRYETVEGNQQANHHVVEARRVELRHGTLRWCALRSRASRPCRRQRARSGGSSSACAHGHQLRDRGSLQAARLQAPPRPRGRVHRDDAELNNARVVALKERS